MEVCMHVPFIKPIYNDRPLFPYYLQEKQGNNRTTYGDISVNSYKGTNILNIGKMFHIKVKSIV